MVIKLKDGTEYFGDPLSIIDQLHQDRLEHLRIIDKLMKELENATGNRYHYPHLQNDVLSRY